MSEDLTHYLEVINERANNTLRKLESLTEEQQRDTIVHDRLDKFVTDLRVERVALKDLGRAQGVELRLIAAELKNINDNVDRARKDLNPERSFPR